jgi:hypothetical protein
MPAGVAKDAGYPSKETAMRKAIIYFSDNDLDPELSGCVVRNLLEVAGDAEIVAVTQRPMSEFKHNIVIGELPRSRKSMFAQIIIGCRNTNADVVCLAEHDVFYNNSHFDSLCPQPYIGKGPFACYDINVVLCDVDGFYWQQDLLLSMGMFDRLALMDDITAKSLTSDIGHLIWCEPGLMQKCPITIDDKWTVVKFASDSPPNVDIIHDRNLARPHYVTDKTWYPKLREVSGFGTHKDFVRRVGLDRIYAGYEKK